MDLFADAYNFTPIHFVISVKVSYMYIYVQYNYTGQFPRKCPMFYNIITIKMLCA